MNTTVARPMYIALRVEKLSFPVLPGVKFGKRSSMTSMSRDFEALDSTVTSAYDNVGLAGAEKGGNDINDTEQDLRVRQNGKFEKLVCMSEKHWKEAVSAPKVLRNREI